MKIFSVITRFFTEVTKKCRYIRDWNESCDSSFTSLKQTLTSSPFLVHPIFDLLCKGRIKASQFAIGGTLAQMIEGKELIFSYFHKKLNDAQINYSANDRDLLGLVGFLSNFR